MDTLGVIGLSWRHASPSSIARFTVPVAERAPRLPAVAREVGARELVYIATCNRVEVALVADDRTPLATYRPRVFAALTGTAPRPGEADRTFHAWRGEGAAEHLALVASGLDSARLGETEILGQVRDSYEACRALALTGPQLDLVMEEVLRIGARVHRATRLGGGHVSLAEIALAHLHDRLRRTRGPAAIVGVSPMTTRCAEALAAEGVPIVVVNRTLARAVEFARRIGAEPRSLADFRAQPDGVEAILLATASPEPVLERPHLERLAARTPSGEAPLVVDMAVPPDVRPEDARTAGLERLGMDEITAEAEANRRHRLLEMADARVIVDEALVGLRRRLADRLLGPIQAALHRRFQRTAAEGVERLLAKHLPTLGDTERQALRRWAETLARRFAYLPSAGLRSLAFNHGPDGVKAFLDGLDGELAAELEKAVGRRSPPTPEAAS